MGKDFYFAPAAVKNTTKNTTENQSADTAMFSNLLNSLRSVVKVAAILAIFSLSVFSQTTSTTYPLNSHTPASIAPGAPSGSYPLSDIENINLFSGSLNVNLPLLEIGGRGSAGYTMSLPIENRWQIQDAYYPSGTWGGGPPPPGAYAHHYYPQHGWWSEGAGFGPGRLERRRSSTFKGACPYTPEDPIYGGQVLSTITFSGPGGTEMTFFDRRTGGTPAVYTSAHGCNISPDGANRGKVWVTGDGSNVVFVTSSDFIETPGSNAADISGPSGDMYFPDGTHYRIIGGKVTYINDRNGNKVSFIYGSGGRVSTITDSLNRTLTNLDSGGSQKVISFSGFGGAVRSIEIGYEAIGSNVLRAGYTLKGVNELFPELGADVQNQTSPQMYNVVSYVKLPNNKQYNFKYNSYGDIARIELPTGGAIEYDWDGIAYPGCGARVRRWITERRVYPDGGTGTGYESKTTYERGTLLVTVTSYDGSNNPLSITKHYFTSEDTSCAYGTESIPDRLPKGRSGREYKTEAYSANGTLLQRVETDFEYRTMSTVSGDKQVDYRPIRETTTLGNISPNLVSKREFGYDQSVDLTRQTDVWEYDYGSGQTSNNLKRHSHTDYLSTNPVNNIDYLENNIRLVNLPLQIWISSDIVGNNRLAVTKYEYDNYNSDSLHAPLMARDDIIGHWRTEDQNSFNTSYITRGNLTKITSYVNAMNETAGSVSNASQYDIAGNIIKAIDAKEYALTINFSDSFGSPDSDARINRAPDQLNEKQTYAFPTSISNPLQFTSYIQYDYFTEKVVNNEDINGVVSKSIYNDLLDRPTQIITAIGTSNEKQTSIIYHDNIADRKIEIKNDLNILNDNLLKTESLYDGLGRTVETRKYELNGEYTTTKAIPFLTVQDPESSAWRKATKVSNPYRPLANEPPVWTTILNDELDRTIKIITPGGAISKTEFNGNITILTDEAGKKRRTVEDVLDRLIRVDEPDENTNELGSISTPTQATNYGYDVLGNLTQVAQGGQTRSFNYDSLSRLISATNPESGTFQYTYDNNGNLLTKTDARNITTTYAYDALNRITLRDYSDTTPDISYIYDDENVSKSKGKLTRVASSVSETLYMTFDADDNVLSSRQITDGQIYNFGYTYNLNGDLVTQTYPSTKVVKYDYSANGELTQIKNNLTQKIYANSISYTPHGQVERMRLGNGKWESTKFNSSLQITEIGLGHSATNTGLWKTQFDYGEWENDAINQIKNNGNLARQTITVPTIGTAAGFIAIQNYSYDKLDRLKSAAETVSGVEKWKQSFDYDRFGNKRFKTSGTTLLSSESNVPKIANPEILISNNRYKQDQDNDGIDDYLYDASGNITKNAKDQTFTFDAENRQTTALANNVSMTYVYDGNDKRVKTFNSLNNQTTVFIYNAIGDLTAEYTINSPPPTNPTISYLTEDALGSVRVVTNSFGDIKARRDFLPFGEEIFAGIGNRNINQKYSASGDDTRKKFATYQRDVETGLDYAQSRYYSPMTGRFTSPDEFKGGPDELFDFEEDASDNPTFYADLTNPQSLNKYQYTYNNPYKYNDPSGHCPPCFGQVFLGPAVTELLPAIAPKSPLVEGASIAVPRGGTTIANPTTFGDPVTIIPYPGLVFPRRVSTTATEGAREGAGQVAPTQRRRAPYSPPTPRRTSRTHPSRKRAKEAAEHPKPGKKLPQPKKTAPSKKRKAYEEQQKYKNPERDKPGSKHPDSHFHDKNKSRNPVNTHHRYPKRF